MNKIKSFIFLLISISFFSCKFNEELKLPITKDKIGIGVVSFNLNEPISFYVTDTALKPYDELHFEKIKLGFNKGKCKFVTDKLGNKLSPYIMDSGDSDTEAEEHIQSGLIRFFPELTFKVIEKTDKGFVVVINEETLETSFINVDFKNDLRKNSNTEIIVFDPNFVDSKIANWFYYETWGQRLKQSMYIDYSVDDVYDKPDGIKIKMGTELHSIDSVHGDWARLTTTYCEPKNKNFAWIKWKDNDSIKVTMIMHLYD